MKAGDAHQAAFNRVVAKQLDFLLCERGTSRPVLALELDDRAIDAQHAAAMPAYGVDIEIDAPPSVVFAYVADLTRHGEWSADPLEIRQSRAVVESAVGTNRPLDRRARPSRLR